MSPDSMNITLHPWSWTQTPPTFNEKASQVLGQYVQLPRDLWESHVSTIRDLAWQAAPWPCIGLYGFLSFHIAGLGEYDEIVSRLREGQSFLEIGSGLGQELRALACDGVDPACMTAIEPETKLWDLGFNMMRDKDRFCNCHFLPVDIFDEQRLFSLKGKFNIIWSANFMHFFDKEQQVRVATIMLDLLDKSEGNIIVGMSVGGREEAGLLEGRWYRHNEKSIQDLWCETAGALGVRVITSANLVDKASDGTPREGPLKQLYWSVRILEADSPTP